ncbi:DUF6884 domain-containing protein [Alkalicoccus saliphilus]|uniref:DUF6884 domain-containing protein n=1 Tax=Alkalicoccus saliphilus TaxID=200989 RepID=A0A2T4U843_9BACI|nr:DUF6884 domain-containing protein [Alkalicoccus saliphilus]PTL39555.1 hypothetical protein C6Y45_05805 [Alkalicoccus saliphilus]
MNSLCIIPCGRKKVWDDYPELKEVPAGEAYTGTLHRKSRAYADTFCTDVRILSAKHGFLALSDKVEENYDLSFHSSRESIISVKNLQIQVMMQELLHYDKITVLTGKKYRPFLEKVFPGETVNYPLFHCRGIGYILRELQSAVDTLSPLPEHLVKHPPLQMKDSF